MFTNGLKNPVLSQFILPSQATPPWHGLLSSQDRGAYHQYIVVVSGTFALRPQLHNYKLRIPRKQWTLTWEEEKPEFSCPLELLLCPIA